MQIYTGALDDRYLLFTSTDFCYRHCRWFGGWEFRLWWAGSCMLRQSKRRFYHLKEALRGLEMKCLMLEEVLVWLGMVESSLMIFDRLSTCLWRVLSPWRGGQHPSYRLFEPWKTKTSSHSIGKCLCSCVDGRVQGVLAWSKQDESYNRAGDAGLITFQLSEHVGSAV
jgi:hypothetical protein